MLDALDRLGVGWSVGVRNTIRVEAVYAAIGDEEAWTAIDYPKGGEAQVAETVSGDDQPQEAVAAAQAPSHSTPHPHPRTASSTLG